MILAVEIGELLWVAGGALITLLLLELLVLWFKHEPRRLPPTPGESIDSGTDVTSGIGTDGRDGGEASIRSDIPQARPARRERE